MANTNNSITNWLFHLKNGIANRNQKTNKTEFTLQRKK